MPSKARHLQATGDARRRCAADPADSASLSVRAPDAAVLTAFLQEQGFRSVVARMGLGEAAGDAGTPSAQQCHGGGPAPRRRCRRPIPATAPLLAATSCVTRSRRSRAGSPRRPAAGVVALDTETDSLIAHARPGSSASALGTRRRAAPATCRSAIAAAGGTGRLLADRRDRGAGADPLRRRRRARCSRLLEDRSVLKIGQNIEIRHGGVCQAALRHRHRRRSTTRC